MRMLILILLISLGSAMAVAEEDHWSLQPIAAPDVPQDSDSAWPRSDLDRFILRKLDEQGLQPVADASRETLVRRTYFNLIGLPPTPAQIETFLEESDQDAEGGFRDARR